MFIPFKEYESLNFKYLSYPTNRGIEITLNAVPVQTADFTWDVGVNFTRNENHISRFYKI